MVMKEMLDELERHRDDEARRTVWMQLITPQLEAMGIVLVAHFKVLLPLLFHWLHANDDTTCLLVNPLSVIPFDCRVLHEHNEKSPSFEGYGSLVGF